MTWFQCRDRCGLGFCVGVEIDLIFVSGHRNRLDFSVGIEIDLDNVCGPKMACF